MLLRNCSVLVTPVWSSGITLNRLLGFLVLCCCGFCILFLRDFSSGCVSHNLPAHVHSLCYSNRVPRRDSPERFHRADWHGFRLYGLLCPVVCRSCRRPRVCRSRPPPVAVPVSRAVSDFACCVAFCSATPLGACLLSPLVPHA